MAGSGYIVVPVQKAFTALRIIQVIIGVAVLALSCYPVSLTSGYGSAYIFEPGALAIFTGIATGIFVAYWFIANSASNQKKLYNYWAIFAVEFFVWVFWLTTFALYASFVSASLSTMGDYDTTSYSSSSNTYCYAGYCVSAKRGLLKRYVSDDPVSGTIYTALALSIVNFILFSVTLILFTVNLTRHRSAAHVEDGHGATTAPTYAGQNASNYAAPQYSHPNATEMKG